MKRMMEQVKDIDELRALPPKDRHRYVRNVLLNALDVNKDYPISELMSKTNLNRNTITKHLDDLVSLQQVIKTTRGIGRNQISFYKRAKMKPFEEDQGAKKVTSGNMSYIFFLMESSENKSICIQQREFDDFGVEKVVGSVTIKDENIKSFIRELHTYSAKMINT